MARAPTWAISCSDGVIDAFCFGAGIPVPTFSELDAAQQVVFFTWTDPELATIRKSHAGVLRDRAFPRGPTSSRPNDQKTVGLFNFSIANKDMSDDLAYTITKTILENNAAMVRAHPAAKETVAANATRNSFLPFHPGAVRYYKEKGIKLDPGALRSNLAACRTRSLTSAVIPTACTGKRFSKTRSVPSITARSTTSGTPTISRSPWPGSRTAACSPRSGTSS